MECSEIPWFIWLLMGIIAFSGFGLAFKLWYVEFKDDQRAKEIDKAFRRADYFRRSGHDYI